MWHFEIKFSFSCHPSLRFAHVGVWVCMGVCRNYLKAMCVSLQGVLKPIYILPVYIHKGKHSHILLIYNSAKRIS